MIFKLDNVKRYFNDEDKIKYEEMGFSFDELMDDDECKWRIDHDKLPTIIFNDAGSLKAWWLAMDIKCTLIIDFEDNEIEIYDDYRE